MRRWRAEHPDYQAAYNLSRRVVPSYVYGGREVGWVLNDSPRPKSKVR